MSEPTKGPIRDRYAEAIIEDPKHFDAVEVQGLRKYIDRNGVELFDIADGHTSVEMYGVYAHFVEGGIACCGDFTHYEDALEYGKGLADRHGWSVNDFTAFADSISADKQC